MFLVGSLTSFGDELKLARVEVRLARLVFLVTSSMFLVGALTFGDELELARVDLMLASLGHERSLG